MERRRTETLTGVDSSVYDRRFKYKHDVSFDVPSFSLINNQLLCPNKLHIRIYALSKSLKYYAYMQRFHICIHWEKNVILETD